MCRAASCTRASIRRTAPCANSVKETGLDVRLTGLAGIFMDTYGETGDATLNVFYTGEVSGGQETAGSDATGLRWFAADEIPGNVAFVCNRQAIAAWKNGLLASTNR